MKKILTVLLCLFMVLSLCACAPSQDVHSTGTGFRVGYGREKIMPEESVPLAGYGNTDRLSTGFLDPLYLDCIATTDAKGNTLLIFSGDTRFDPDTAIRCKRSS